MAKSVATPSPAEPPHGIVLMYHPEEPKWDPIPVPVEIFEGCWKERGFVLFDSSSATEGSSSDSASTSTADTVPTPKSNKED